MRRIGAVDVGGTKIAVGIVRDDGKILHRSECPTDAKRGFQDAVLRIQRMLHQEIDSMWPHRRRRRRMPGSARSIHRSDRKRRHIARLGGRPPRA